MKKYRKVFILFLMCIVVIMSLPSISLAATVGQSLTNPESGWQRIDDTDTKIKYTGTWTTDNDSRYASNLWNNAQYLTNESSSIIEFKFYGTKLRLIGNPFKNKCTDNTIIIDGVSDTFSAYNSDNTAVFRGLMYEKTGLDNKVHTVVIKPSTSMTTSQNLSIDAIDIDDNGYLVETEEPTTNSLKVVVETGESLQLSVNDNLSHNSKMSWASSDGAVAKVDSQGVVSGITPGNAVITVTNANGTYKETINILVIDGEPQVAVDLTVGDTRRLTVDDLANTANVTWTCDDTAIATVDNKGKVTAVAQGTTLVTVKDDQGNEIGKIYIRVRN